VLRCLRDTGMPIAQMRRYAELARCGEPTMTERLALLIEHDAEVARRIAALQAEQAHLQEKIGWYRTQLQADNASDPVLLPLLGVFCGDIHRQRHPITAKSQLSQSLRAGSARGLHSLRKRG
jgi:DNA-binding transcriptional MerR regulator